MNDNDKPWLSVEITDPVVLAMWDELYRQSDLSDANPPPEGMARFPSGWHVNEGGQGTAINLIDLARVVRAALA